MSRTQQGSRRARRGATLMESMATMVVLIFGIMGVTLTVLAASRQNRRNLTQAQASLIAERELERITALGCTGVAPAPLCGNIQALDGTTRTLWWAADGEPSETAPPPGLPRLQFDVAVDVDPGPGGLFEGIAMGSPPVNRVVAGQMLEQVINVRVLVSWRAPQLLGIADTTRYAVALQTRMVP